MALNGVMYFKELASLRTSLFLRYNTEHIFYLLIIINKLNYCIQYIKLYRVMSL